MNKVEKKFQDRGIIQPGGWSIYSKEDSIEFVKECQKEAIVILGIDAFFVFEGNIVQPSLDNSIDFSSGIFKALENVYEEALTFFNDKGDNLFFEIVCSD